MFTEVEHTDTAYRTKCGVCELRRVCRRCGSCDEPTCRECGPTESADVPSRRICVMCVDEAKEYQQWGIFGPP